MGSTTEEVSVFILGMLITILVTFLGEVEGKASVADSWGPLSTIAKWIILIVACLPPETNAVGAIRAPAAPLSFFVPEC